MKITDLSGKSWWKANQAKYPNSRRIVDLDTGFRTKVTRFLRVLQVGGATVRVSSTRRNRIRAHLMHYSWRISHGSIHPTKVPRISGLRIDWDHGDVNKSRKAAREMVRLFRMAHIASTKSNHIYGKAIDMRITWRGNLQLRYPRSGWLWRISSKPRNGNNKALHWIGGQYGVRKLVSDPPHWSHNGR